MNVDGLTSRQKWNDIPAVLAVRDTFLLDRMVVSCLEIVLVVQ